MIGRLFPSLFVICCACGYSIAVAEWKVATWNLQNYLVCNRYEDGVFRFLYPMPENRKKRIRDLILSEQPDLLFLQELGDAHFLQELQLDLKASGLHYPYYQFSGFDGARTGLAWLSKLPPSECIFHDLSMRRGLQEVRFRGKSIAYRFFHVHLKSRFSDDPSDPASLTFRSREIEILANALNAFVLIDPASMFFLVGDFNTPFSDPLLDPLRTLWTPRHAADACGNPFTYFHRSGTSDIIDGFWMHRSPEHVDSPVRILPLPDNCPSDHRLVIFNLPSPS